MRKVEILSLAEAKKWTSYLKKLPPKYQDIYYTPEYYSLFEKLGDGKATCFIFEQNGDIALYPFLVNSVNELGFNLNKNYSDIQGAYGYNGVVSSSYDPEFINDFHTSFNAFCKENNVIAEFTRFNPILANHKFSEKWLQTFFDRNTVKLTIENYSSIDEILLKSYSKEARKNCRKAEKQGLRSSIATNKSEYIDFYALYLNTIQYIGADKYYYFDQDFFAEIFKTINSNQKLILIWFNKKIVGGFILLKWGQYVHNLFSAGSHLHRDLNINDYMQDIAIRIAFEEKASQMHFGGGNSNKREDPLFQFKAKFSDERGDFFIGKKIHNQDVYDYVVSQWQLKNQDKAITYEKLILKYRY